MHEIEVVLSFYICFFMWRRISIKHPKYAGMLGMFFYLIPDKVTAYANPSLALNVNLKIC